MSVMVTWAPWVAVNCAIVVSSVPNLSSNTTRAQIGVQIVGPRRIVSRGQRRPSDDPLAVLEQARQRQHDAGGMYEVVDTAQACPHSHGSGQQFGRDSG